MGAKARPAVPALVEMLRGDDRRTAAFAAWALVAIGPDVAEAVPALVAVLDKDWAALDVLTRAVVQSDNAFVRRHSARALGHSDAGHQAVEALAQVLVDADPDVRREAVWAFALIGPPDEPARAALKKALGDEDYVVRFAAAEALNTGE
jgi:HEAT repeat protein